ncbi:MAG TPA: hypothetical protein VHD76_01110 [Bryobacteraceae bacterium]|jgi:hypothetical protein|nr:hypothetical protein [Bryobacteraceae bacterium]
MKSKSMSQLGEAVARYHRLLEAEPYRDLSWAAGLQNQMKQQKLALAGRPVSPVLRPHFVSRRQYTNMAKAAETLMSAVDRLQRLALANPALLTRMQLLPAEKMLASLDPGYSLLSVTSLLDTHLNNGTLRFVQYNSETPVGVAYTEALSDLFYDAPPVKEFRKRYHLVKLGGAKPLLSALLKAYKEWGGKNKKPQIALVEFRQPFQGGDSNENALLADFFRSQGYAAKVVSAEELEYRNGVLASNGFQIDLVFRRLRVQEFLVRFDLSHPLLRAYRDGAACVVNNFRSELAQKRAIFDLLTDEAVTASFPAAEKRAVREFVPWTRIVAAAKTSYLDQQVDLPEFIRSHREKLVLRPNDDSGEQATVRGADVDETGWDRALRAALRNPYVVQEVTEPVRSVFPLLSYGHLELRELNVDVHPHSYLGKVQGCSTWLSAGGPNSFSTLAGLAPTYILEPK